jgi:hypothetical protein
MPRSGLRRPKIQNLYLGNSDQGGHRSSCLMLATTKEKSSRPSSSMESSAAWSWHRGDTQKWQTSYGCGRILWSFNWTSRTWTWDTHVAMWTFIFDFSWPSPSSIAAARMRLGDKSYRAWEKKSRLSYPSANPQFPSKGWCSLPSFILLILYGQAFHWLCVPSKLVESASCLPRWCNSGALRMTRTLSKISKRFFWPKMTQRVTSYVRSCE